MQLHGVIQKMDTIFKFLKHDNHETLKNIFKSIIKNLKTFNGISIDLSLRNIVTDYITVS